MNQVKKAGRLRTTRRAVLMFRMIFMSSLMIQGQNFDPCNFQKEFIAEFTGHGPVEGTLDVLKQRSSPTERLLAENFLAKTLTTLGLPVNRHEYKMPNSFFLLDLFFAPVEGTNVYTIVPSTVPSDEYVILGAHYDSEPGSPGAGDNASGVAMMLTLAKQISELPVRNKKFVIVFFDQEEDDEVGSKAFAKKLKNNGIKVHSVHVTDVIGWDANKDLAVELQSPSQGIETIYRESAGRFGIPISISQGGSSDNKSFLAAGYNTVGVFSDEMTPHIHKATDTLETIDFEYLESATKLVFDVMKTLAKQK